MRGPKPPVIELTAAERHDVDQWVRCHSTPQQLAWRTRIVLAAAAGANNSQIARQEGVEVDTARLWRTRWVALQAVAGDELSVADRLTDAPRPVIRRPGRLRWTMPPASGERHPGAPRPATRQTNRADGRSSRSMA